MEDKRGFKKFWHFPDEDLLFMSQFCDFNAAPQWQCYFTLFCLLNLYLQFSKQTKSYYEPTLSWNEEISKVFENKTNNGLSRLISSKASTE